MSDAAKIPPNRRRNSKVIFGRFGQGSYYEFIVFGNRISCDRPHLQRATAPICSCASISAFTHLSTSRFGRPILQPIMVKKTPDEVAGKYVSDPKGNTVWISKSCGGGVVR